MFYICSIFHKRDKLVLIGFFLIVLIFYLILNLTLLFESFDADVKQQSTFGSAGVGRSPTTTSAIEFCVGRIREFMQSDIERPTSRHKDQLIRQKKDNSR